MMTLITMYLSLVEAVEGSGLLGLQQAMVRTAVDILPGWQGLVQQQQQQQQPYLGTAACTCCCITLLYHAALGCNVASSPCMLHQAHKHRVYTCLHTLSSFVFGIS